MTEARIGKRKCRMQDVPMGREFAVGGRVYQLTSSPVQFDRVAIGSRFRRDDIWYKRTGPCESRILDPNMPLADPGGITVNIGKLTRVFLVEFTLRGLDEQQAAPAERTARAR
ncbi:MAG: hypothetical protein KBD06_01115 [Candidatus Pacebacteria bacterium]|nr:hypothetical protein [Candidatus Paceibacterota bacterium]